MQAELRNTIWDGAKVGLDGASVAEIFHVTVDVAGNNPFIPLQASVVNDRYGRSGVPLRQAHPDPMFALTTASEYSVVEPMPPLDFHVRVDYTTPDTQVGGGSFGGWTVSARSQSGTEHIGRSLPDLNSRGNPISDTRKLIGSHVYKPVLPPGTGQGPQAATHRAISPVTGQTIDLVQMGLGQANPPKNVVGFDRITSALELVFSKTVASMTKETYRALGSIGAKVNIKSFFGFPATTLRFEGVAIDESTALDALGQVQFEYPISLVFLNNPDGWTPIKRIETYEIDRAEAPVFPVIVGTGDQVVEESFEVYERFPFDDIFSIIDGTLPLKPGKRVPRVPLP